MTKNSASTTTWKRASVSFEITGGNPNAPTFPITLLFDSSDARDSYGAYIDNIMLIPVEVKVVDRDDPKKQWSDAQDGSGRKLYAGETTGDMVSWKLGGTDSWSSVNFNWSAEGPNSQTIQGPSDTGKNEWKIADSDEDRVKNSLKWKPGKWKIKVQVGSVLTEFEQQVGWRTEDYLVIGQIVQTHTHDRDAPPLIAAGDYPWEISSPVALFRRAVTDDIATWLPLGAAGDAICNAATVTPLPITAKLSEVHFIFWSLMSHSLTPTGPFTCSWPLGKGSVAYGNRYWMVQHMLNISPDAPLAPAQLPASDFDATRNAKQFRVLHRYQNKFLVGLDGKIEAGSVKKVNQVADEGVTKLKFGVEAGEFQPLWNNPEWAVDLTTEPPETNQYHGKEQTSSDRTKTSSFATARIGAKGRNVNWRLFGKDAPWIYAEIIFEVKADSTIETTIKASVDVIMRNEADVQGTKQFNNLNIYKAKPKTLDDGSVVINYDRLVLLPMAGKLEPFINSASGQWPEPAIPPSVQ